MGQLQHDYRLPEDGHENALMGSEEDPTAKGDTNNREGRVSKDRNIKDSMFLSYPQKTQLLCALSKTLREVAASPASVIIQTREYVTPRALIAS